MVDTVAVVFPVIPTLTQLQEWVCHQTTYPKEMTKLKFTKNIKLNGTVDFKFTYHPSNPIYRDPHLRVEVSLPKVLFGDNIQLIEEQSQLDDAIALTNAYLSGLHWLPPVDFGQGTLFKVDASTNYFVRDLAPDYIRAISLLKYLQRHTRPYIDCGVQFFSRKTTTTFYDKGVICPAAQGILRQETSMRHLDNIEERIHKSNPTLRDVTMDWLADILQKDLVHLRLNDAIITNRDQALDILKSKYGKLKGYRLFGYLVERQNKNRDQLLAEGYSPDTLQKNDKAIHDAGIALTMTEKTSLPALKIVRK